MKKSFLKRVMAAAVAVPVALTQTAMFASFAAGEETGSDNKIIDKSTFLDIPSDATKIFSDDYKAIQTENAYAFVQENNWNGDLRAALTAMYDEEVVLDPAKLADSVSSTAWFSEFLKSAVRAEGTTATAKVMADDVVITLNVDYNYGQDAANRMVAGLGDAYKAAVANLNSKALVKGTITITADVSQLDEFKDIPVEYAVKFDGMKDGKLTETVIPYIQGIYDTVQAEVTAAVEAAGLDVSALDSEWTRCQGKINTAQRAINRAGNSYSSDYTAADAEELWAKARAEAIERSDRFTRIPATIADGKDTNAYAAASAMFDQVVEKINEKCAVKGNGYTVVMSLDDVVDTVNELTDISATAEATEYNYYGTLFGYLPDDDFDADAYTEYFNEVIGEENEALAKEGKKKVLMNINSVKCAEIGAAELTDAQMADASLNVYRVVWPNFEIVDIEETSEASSESDTNPSDATNETGDTDATGNTDETGNTDTTGNTDETGDTDIVVTRSDVKLEVEGGFYFSHDPRAFADLGLIKNATITEDGAERAITEDEMKNFSFSFRRNSTLTEAEPTGEAVSPQSAYADKSLNATGSYFAQTIYVYYEGQLVKDAEATVYIGVKGDVNNDGVANASDAAKVLIYAAKVGANKPASIYSEDNAEMERFAYFLGDTNGESEDNGKTASYDATVESPLNASDAAQILIYSAAVNASSDGKADWIPKAIKMTPYPKYSEEIAKAAGLI